MPREMTIEDAREEVGRVEAREAYIAAVIETLTTVRVWEAEWRLPGKGYATVRRTVTLESKQHGPLTLITDEESRGLYISEQGLLGAPVVPCGFSLRGFNLDREDGTDGRRAARAHVRKALKRYGSTR